MSSQKTKKQELIDYIFSLTEEQFNYVIARMDELEHLITEEPTNHRE